MAYINKPGSIRLLFTAAIFVSACLLFLVELMIARMILPLLGGTPAVWNTCMMFFQFALLAGYLYAHLVNKWASLRQQLIMQGVLLALAAMTLPVAVSKQWMPSGESNPIAAVLIILSFSIGLPFFMLSSSAPLLQRWFVQTGHPKAGNPYFLYSASNAGSLLALISYPLFIEPTFRLKEQGALWTAGYGVLFALTITCAAVAWRARSKTKESASAALSPDLSDNTADAIGLRRKLLWLALAFVPSSLMLGVTSYLTTDIASIPLFWVIPLSLYLLSFIFVFSGLPQRLHRVMLGLAPAAIILQLALNSSYIKPSVLIMFLVNLGVFFIIAMACHGELARTKPSARRLTEFYLWMSIGGVLGGIFNAIVAPIAFESIAEYPLTLAFGALFIPLQGYKIFRQRERLNTLFGIALPVLMIAVLGWFMAENPIISKSLSGFTDSLGLKTADVNILLAFWLPALLCYILSFLRNPMIFRISVMVLAISFIFLSDWTVEKVIYRNRSFFGTIKILRSADNAYHLFWHGTTLHGAQRLDPSFSNIPMTYYSPEGPAGQIFEALKAKKQTSPVAIIGLGAGALAAYYPEPGRQFTFYEIDPAVARVAKDPKLFTYLKNSPAKIDIVIGDARLKIGEAPDRHYGLIVLDAFSSDAIPVHLLTREAVKLYMSKLEDKGILAMHISSKYLDLEPVIKKLAEDAGLTVRISQGQASFPARWVALARNESDLGNIMQDTKWTHIFGKSSSAVWTDDYSNILSIIKSIYYQKPQGVYM